MLAQQNSVCNLLTQLAHDEISNQLYPINTNNVFLQIDIGRSAFARNNVNVRTTEVDQSDMCNYDPDSRCIDEVKALDGRDPAELGPVGILGF